MKHLASPRFWRHYRLLPESVRNLANKNFELLKADPHHPSLHLKKVGELWSVRVGRIIERWDWLVPMELFGFGSAHTQNTTGSFNRAEQLRQPTISDVGVKRKLRRLSRIRYQDIAKVAD